MVSDDQILPSDLLTNIGRRTPARLFMGRTGSSYLTSHQIKLREAHAAAADAVHQELHLLEMLGKDSCRELNLFEVKSEASSKAEYLLRPDYGRKLGEEGRRRILERCPQQPDVQLVIGDGLSVSAVAAQVPILLPELLVEFRQKNWSAGQPFVVRYCRVGIMNDIGDLLSPKVIVLLIGERPGLTTAESLSAYLGYRPRAGHTDADRNLISNIHNRGTPARLAVVRIVELVSLMLRRQVSGARLNAAASLL